MNINLVTKKTEIYVKDINYHIVVIKVVSILYNNFLNIEMSIFFIFFKV